MRTASVYAVTCVCGKSLEWPSAESSHRCQCGRLVTIKERPNHSLMTIQPARKEPLKCR